MRRLRRPLSVVLLLLAASGLCVPAAALAQSSPFAPIPQATPDQTPTVATTASNSTTSSGDLSSTDEILLFGGGVIVLTAIIYFIWRDARRRAPLKADENPYDEGSMTTPHHRKRQARAKDKRARQARKRNRKK